MKQRSLCQSCGEPFEWYTCWSERRFCSATCWSEYRRRQRLYTCEQCGSVQERKRANENPRFCSMKCAAAAKRRPSSSVEMTCLRCGTAFATRHSSTKYCSSRCMQLARWEQMGRARLHIPCEVCGVEFVPPRSAHGRVWCSLACRDEYRYGPDLPGTPHTSCRECGISKPHTLRHFVSEGGKPGQWCRECHRRTTRAYQTRKREHAKRVGLQLDRSLRGGPDRILPGEKVAGMLTEQDGKCAYCREILTGELHIDHIVSIALGGDDDPANMVLTCVHCNMTKSWGPLSDFLARRDDLDVYEMDEKVQVAYYAMYVPVPEH